MITFIYFYAQSLASSSSARMKQQGIGGEASVGSLLDHGNDNDNNVDEKDNKID